MIKAILLDLDNTLVRTGDESVFSHSMKLVSGGLRELAEPDDFVTQAISAVRVSRDNLNPTTTVGDTFYRTLNRTLGCPPNVVASIFQHFYAGGQHDPRVPVLPQDAAGDLLNWLFASGYTVGVAADPVVPWQAIQQHMAWGGFSMETYPFHWPASLDSMHFTKPHPHFFEEILAALDLKPEETLMVGDDWQADIRPAIAAGLHTYWVTTSPQAGPVAQVSGYGTLADFLALAKNADWLASLHARERNPAGYVAHLLGSVAAIDSLLRETPPDQLTFQPDDGEWSVRDAVCHLRDHEVEVDQPRLRRVIEEDNPFLSATDYDPRGHSHEYVSEDARQAFRAFVRRRMQTIAMLEAVPDDAWDRTARHSIFGPTTLHELVRFMAEHDRIHLRQMREAVNEAGGRA